jgi:hypothetical protein
MRAKLIADGVLSENAYVVIAGPANTYSHYVMTTLPGSTRVLTLSFSGRLPHEKSMLYNDMKAALRSSENVSQTGAAIASFSFDY